MADSIDQIAPAGRVTAPAATTAPDLELELIVAGEHSDPHRLLGLHHDTVRAYRPEALAMRVVPVEVGGGPAPAGPA
ncbi:MAG: hypothetical protein M3083_15910, partial [Actinomycetota bacterium]|nr:hypothetical protein [Actinomycetota bacterium]